MKKLIAVIATVALLLNSLSAPFVVSAQEETPSPTPEAVVEETATPEATPEVTPEEIATPTPEVTPVATDLVTPAPSDTPVATQAPESTPTVQGPPDSALPTAQPTTIPEAPIEHGTITETIITNIDLSGISLLNSNLDSPAVTTDKPDYSPTSIALISGTGFVADKTYTIEISSADEPPVTNVDSVTADSQGSFTYSYQLDGNYRPNYKVEIKSGEVVVASTTFTDTSLSCSPNPTNVGTSVTCSANGVGNDKPAHIIWYDGNGTQQFSNSCNSGSCASTHSPNNQGTWTIKFIKDSGSVLITTTALTVNNSSTAITVTANSGQTKVYGSADPTFTYTYSPSSPTVTFSGALSRNTGEGVGSYAITQGTLSATGHTITFNSADFSITRKSASVTPNANGKVYGDSDPVLTGTLTGFLAGDSVTAVYNRVLGESVSGSPYTISAVLSPSGVLGNYAITYNTANFTISKRDITVTANANGKVYGESDPTLTYTNDSLVGSDTFSGSLSRNAGENVGTYAITQGSLTAGNNYAINFVPANFIISSRDITVTADNLSKNFGEIDPTFTYTITDGSLVGTDTFSGVLSRDPGEDVGTYDINKGTLSLNGNYSLTFIGGTFEIIDNTNPTTPTANPPAGDYFSDQSVILSSTDTGSGLDKIYYTTDGTDPDKTSTEFTSAITVDHDLTIKAIAYDKVGNASDILTAIYGIAPVISEETSGTVTESTAVVTWTTDDLSTSRVVYDTVSHSVLGAAPNYDYAFSTVEDPTKVTSHSVNLSGLSANTIYYYRTISHGSPEATSTEQTFTTLQHDVCTNIAGIQTSVPDGLHLNATGLECVAYELGGPPSSQGGNGGAVLGITTTSTGLTSYWPGLAYAGTNNSVEDVLGAKTSASPAPTATPEDINPVAHENTGILNWISTHKKISLGIAALALILGFVIYKKKKNK